MTILAADAHDLIPALCRQFAAATGWPLQFTAAPTEQVHELGSQLLSSAECCWSTDVCDAAGRIGYLHLTSPDADWGHAPREAVFELAGAIAQLLTRVCSVTQRLESCTRDVSTMVGTGLAAQREQSLPEALSQLLTSAVQLTGYWSAALFLLNPSLERLKLRATYRVEPSELPFVERRVSDCRADLEALSSGPVFVQRQSSLDAAWLPNGINCALCAAIQSETVPIGTLWVFDRRSHVRIEQEVRLLKTVAGQIATLLERFVLLRESETQQRLTFELRMASEHHGSVIPETLPRESGLEAAGRCVSRHELGGDLCEVIPIGGGRTVIALGDASGNSIPAALVMSAVRGAVRTLPVGDHAQEPDPAETMQRLNEALHAITGPHQFMSLFYGIYSRRTGQLVYCNAGHPNPLLVRRGECSRLESHGMLLGVLGEVSYSASVADLQAGDLLILFSDGISETRNVADELFRIDGITAAIRGIGSADVDHILETIWNRAEAHSRSARELDDRTLLVLRMLPRS